MGPRRSPAIACPPPNTSTSICIFTSVGFRQLEANEYVEATQRLRPDIVIGFADLIIGREPGVKRREKMVDRTHAHVTDATERLYGPTATPPSKAVYFAPILPLENAQQSIYLDELEVELRPYISGLALYDAASLEVVSEQLGDLPRLLLSKPTTPHDLLKEIALGADLLTLPFLTATSDAGMAFDFVFSARASAASESTTPKPLAIDLWSSSYATDLSPLTPGCQCFACQNHHRAYIRHLLSAKEMLAWTLLQIHNHHVIDTFFVNVRTSISNGTFERDARAFHDTYAESLPEMTGIGPRYVSLYFYSSVFCGLGVMLT